MQNPPIDELHEIAQRIARRCLWVVQSVLMEQELNDAEAEFYYQIREELRVLFDRSEGKK